MPSLPQALCGVEGCVAPRAAAAEPGPSLAGAAHPREATFQLLQGWTTGPACCLYKQRSVFYMLCVYAIL